MAEQFELDDEGLPVVPELDATKSNVDKVEAAKKERGIRQRELRDNLRTENENLKAGKNADGTEKEKKEDKKKDVKSETLDRVDKAVLRAEKITDPEELALVESFMKNTGKSVEEVLESKFFQGELKDMRDFKATADASPKDKKRSNTNARDTVDYWLEKGPEELAKLRKENPTLARQVVNAKMKQLKDANHFSNTPVV